MSTGKWVIPFLFFLFLGTSLSNLASHQFFELQDFPNPNIDFQFLILICNL